ncbi:MAG: arylsulfotransferase family protein [Pseudomonadota bacterium]
MERNVPVWAVALIVLCLLLFTMVFGWAVRSTIGGSDRSGLFGRVAVEIAEFPHLMRRTYQEVVQGATGRPDEALSIWPPYAPDQKGQRPLPGSLEAGLVGLSLRGDPGEYRPGWRLLTGTFALAEGEDGTAPDAVPDAAIGDAFGHRALLLSPEMEIARVWDLDAGLVEETAEPGRRAPHAMTILPDLSLISGFDGGRTLRRIGPCGEAMWERAGGYHHAVSSDAGGTRLWTLRNRGDTNYRRHEFVELDAETGEDLRVFNVADIIAANPETGALELRRSLDDAGAGWNYREAPDKWLFDPHHFNDIDPLPPELAEAFPGFEAGDLLISARSIDLVFAVDPDTQELRWYSHGPWIRQHDPDWQPNGTITVYDNRMGRLHSRIVSIDPRSGAVGTRLAGEDTDFHSRIRGKHDITPGGHVLVAATQQGRAFEVAANGDIVLDILNHSADRERSFGIAHFEWLPPDAVEGDGTCPG